MNLFNYDKNKFKLHSGRKSDFKIDCDALTDEDLAALAKKVSQSHLRFREVIGIPKGGLRFAEALKPYCRRRGDILIVDDVYTSGGSMRDFMEATAATLAGNTDSLEFDRYMRSLRGLVIFSRGYVDVDEGFTIDALFHMDTIH